jgi:hypothetical protein
MDLAYVSALAALGGSVVGGLISGIATWLAQRSQIQAGHRTYQISHRQDLFRDFLVAATKAYGQEMMSNEPNLQDLAGMWGMIHRTEVLCVPRTSECARRVVQETIETSRTRHSRIYARR